LKVLVLGSEGFIGSHTVRYLRERGYDVTAADIVLKSEDKYHVINPESPNFPDLFVARRFDACVNATGAANVQFSYSYPYLDFTLNAGNVYSILEAIRLYSPACLFINLSSAAVYGNPERLPVRETDPTAPLSPYGQHKLYSELICREFRRFFGIRTVSLRIFSAYGPGLKKQLFWDLYKKYRTSADAIQLFGTGRETRDFIFIGDLTRAIEAVLRSLSAEHEVINVASGTESTIEEAARLFIGCMDASRSLSFSGDVKQGDPLNWVADISVLSSFGFRPSHSLEQGITETAAWIKGQE
jgi:dTDP-glucose 4,6-dehydratase/UDP-glucose 4-epimerase